MLAANLLSGVRWVGAGEGEILSIQCPPQRTETSFRRHLYVCEKSLAGEAGRAARPNFSGRQSLEGRKSTYWQSIGKGGKKWQFLAKIGKSAITETGRLFLLNPLFFRALRLEAEEGIEPSNDGFANHFLVSIYSVF